MLKTVLDFWWLRRSRAFGTTIIWNLVVFCIRWPLQNILQLTFCLLVLRCCEDSSQVANAGNILFQWICYVRLPVLFNDYVTNFNFFLFLPVDIRCSTVSGFRKCFLCQSWLEARIEMDLSRIELRWVVVVLLISNGIMQSMIQLQSACGHWRLTGWTP